MTNISDQIFIQNALQLTNRTSLSTLLMYGINSGNNIDAGSEAMKSSCIQVDLGYQTEKLGITIGGQHLNNYVSEGTLLGVTNSLTWRLIISNLLKAGKDLRIVQVFAGHKHTSATERYKQTDVEELKIEVLKYHPLG